MTIRIACIVEGRGELEAVPVLLRRMTEAINNQVQLIVPLPIRIDRSKVHRNGEIEKAVHLAAAKVGAGGGLLLILDADDDCPATLGPALLHRAQAARSDFPIASVIASREFESWFIAAVDSLRTKFREPVDAIDLDVERMRGAKEWLSRRLKNGSYSPTVDQASLAALFDLELARKRSQSFDKLWRELERLLSILGNSNG